MNNIYKTQILDGLKKHKLQVLFILLLVLLAKISVIGLPFILKLIIDEIPKYQLEHLSGGLIYLPLLAVGYASFFYPLLYLTRLRYIFLKN